jgi:predicted TIM-barrel fold metal-dependent hydrolase
MPQTKPTLEEIIDPALPIIDPHHHLWDRTPTLPPADQRQHPFLRVLDFAARYLLDEFLADLNSGHNIKASVFLECHSMLKADGPAETRYLGETEFVNGIAAMSASGIYGATKVCAGIVGNVPLNIGARAGELLDQHIKAGGGRFRGVRNAASFDADAGVLGPIARQTAGLYLNPKFREGFAELGKRGLSFDAWMLEPQLPDLIDLARAFPGAAIVLDHVGTPLGVSTYAGRREERFDIWKKNIRELAKCQNVNVKLGGLAMVFCGFPSTRPARDATSAEMAKEWTPYIETCIEAFGPKRCMFESNFPVDGVTCTYPRLWNALKLSVKGASADEKADLFFNTANRFYKLGL